MAFDLDAFREAHRPWRLTAGGRTWIARHVSARQFERYQQRVRDAQGDQRRILLAVRIILRQAFPWRFSYWIHGDPVTVLFGLEPRALNAALADFFRHLRPDAPTTSQEQPMAPSQMTLGPRSSRPTPIASG